jgi:hypothetical protein
MGLDMIPIGKPRPGFENRFNQIYRILHGQETQTLSLLDKLKGRKLLTDKELITEWQENQISSL